MPAQRIVLVDERGSLHDVIAGPDGATIAGRRVSVRPIRAGELRVGEDCIWVAHLDDQRWVFANGRTYVFEVQRRDGGTRKRTAHEDNLSSPMPATVVKLHVAAGDEVRAGQVLLVLEAMKMELPVRATHDARVEAVRCREGQLVQPGQPLIDLVPLTDANDESAE
jgi:biotin carboxyl carrier protein